ncbi:MAG: RNA methyltransferase [Candidatus Planktophila sp.]|nr:RNA methyltransferase [Candidatus Planktophila sp.]
MIESLHSPHIARVKALIGSKGAKERREQGLFVAEGVQCTREALTSVGGPEIKILYATEQGLSKIAELNLAAVEIVEVSEPVLKAMSDTVSPQGLISLCYTPEKNISELTLTGTSTVIYLHEIQDPGNAGTILRTADAMGITAVVTSPDSVDMYSPKVVRSTAGSLWNIPVYEGVTFQALAAIFPDTQKFLLSSHASTSILDLKITGDCIAVFGNEARGVDAAALGAAVTEVTIPMAGNAESLNLSAAASIVMFTLSAKVAG